MLKKIGNHIIAKEKTVIKRQVELTETENKHLAELIGYGYAVCDKIFQE